METGYIDWETCSDSNLEFYGCDCAHDDPDALVVDLTKGTSNQPYDKFKGNKMKLVLVVGKTPIRPVEWILIQKYCKNIRELHVQGHWLGWFIDCCASLFRILSTFSQLVYVDGKCFGLEFARQYWKLPSLRDISVFSDCCEMRMLVEKVQKNQKQFRITAVEMNLFLNLRQLCEVAVSFLF